MGRTEIRGQVEEAPCAAVAKERRQLQGMPLEVDDTESRACANQLVRQGGPRKRSVHAPEDFEPAASPSEEIQRGGDDLVRDPAGGRQLAYPRIQVRKSRLGSGGEDDGAAVAR